MKSKLDSRLWPKPSIDITNRFHFSITSPIPSAANRQISFLSELPQAVGGFPYGLSLPRLPPTSLGGVGHSETVREALTHGALRLCFSLAGLASVNSRVRLYYCNTSWRESKARE